MVETNQATGTRDRSPAYPAIPLKAAVERLAEFDAHFKRSAARPEKVGDAWKINSPATASRVAAALRYYGFLEYREGTNGREITVTEDGRKYLRAQQEETKQEVIKAAALRPKQIAKFWNEWGKDRPADNACLDELVLKNAFSEGGAREFLKVYDATIAYAGLSESDKISVESGEGEDRGDTDRQELVSEKRDSKAPVPLKRELRAMEGERELTTGLLAKDVSFRLIVNGKVGVKEIERLIKKLELDKEILAEPDDAEAGDEAAPVRQTREDHDAEVARKRYGKTTPSNDT